MIVGVGNDIVEIERINLIYKKFGEKFLNKVYTRNEINLFKQNKSRLIYRLANRFAAKEAVLKAFGFGWRDGIKFTEIEILNDHFGKPEVFLQGKTKEILYNSCNLKIININVSISDEKEYVVASALLIQE